MDSTCSSLRGRAVSHATGSLLPAGDANADSPAPVAWPNRRARRGTERPRSGHFRPMDRNAVARLLFSAEAYDRASHRAGLHGGALKRTGLAVLRALANRFHNRVTGRCDPSLGAIARAAGVARSTAALALARLRAAGFLEWTRRGVTVSRRVRGFERSNMFTQVTNAYRLAASPPAMPDPGTSPVLRPQDSKSEGRPETRFPDYKRSFEGGRADVTKDALELEAALARLSVALQARVAAGSVDASM
jgi:DNA-binding MarR family transcriptional regulator